MKVVAEEVARVAGFLTELPLHLGEDFEGKDATDSAAVDGEEAFQN